MRKKVAFLDLNPFFGGGQKFLLSIQENLTNIDDYHFIVRDTKVFNLLTGNNKVLLKTDSILAQILAINRYLKNNKIDLIILNGNRSIYFSALIRSKAKIAYKHTSNAAFSPSKRLVGKLLLNISYLFCRKIVVLFERAKDEILWQKEKVVVINNGVDDPGMPLVENEQGAKVNIACVSRLDGNKGVDWLIKVFEENFAHESNIILSIAGTGNLYDSLLEYITSHNVNNIKLLGFVSDISSFLATSNLFVLPSKFEAFPLSVLEAMSCALPVITTNTGGTSEMVEDGKNGYLIKYLNDKELCDALSKLIYDKSLRLSLGKESLKLYNQKFKISYCVANIENLVNEI